MILNDLAKGKFFTWWESDGLHTGIKLEDRQVFCIDRMESVKVHANKKIDALGPPAPDLVLRFGHDGQAFLCSPLPEGKLVCRRVILMKGEIMHEEDLKPANTGGEARDLTEVYITILLLEKKIESLGNVLRLVKTAIDENLSPDLSHKKIMSTSRVKKLAVPTE